MDDSSYSYPAASVKKMEEPEYVVVAKSLDDDVERIELPTELDNTLGLQTLVGAFPGAHGLKYKNPATGAFRALLIDTTGSKFHPPPDGWSNKVFVVLSHNQQESTSISSHPKKQQVKKSDQNAKRRKLMVESDDADSCDSDTEQGKSRHETAAKRQQGVSSKQKRMMGSSSNIGGKSLADAEQEEELPNKMVDLLVLGLPFELTEEELRSHFEKFGKVVHCEVKTQKGTNSNRGFGFVQMADLESQLKVLKNKVHQIGGRDCHVKIPFTKNALSSKVFVGRIKEGTSTVELRNFFNEEARKIDPDSSVTDVYVPRPFRSFAFVTFSSPVVAKEMIKKAQFTLGETAIYVSSAHSTRPHQQDGQSQLQQFQQQRSNSFQMPDQMAAQAQPQQNYEEMFYNDWYGAAAAGNDRKQITTLAYSNPIGANRMVGPMFTGSSYQQPNPPLPQIPPYTGTPPTAAVAGTQMLNQLETLNLNMGVGHEVVNVLKALISATQTSTNPQQHHQMQILQQKAHGGTVNPVIQTQQQPQYQSSLSPPLSGANGGSSPSRVYVPPHVHQQHQQQQQSSHYQQGRRNGGGSGNSGGASSSNGAWR